MLKAPLGRRDTRHPRVAAQGRHERPGKGLEGRLDDVVGVLARQQADMEGDPGVGRKGHEELLHELGVERADALGGNGQVDVGAPAAREVKGAQDQRLVHGDRRIAVAGDSP